MNVTDGAAAATVAGTIATVKLDGYGDTIFDDPPPAH